jgi:hypothetical protein
LSSGNPNGQLGRQSHRPRHPAQLSVAATYGAVATDSGTADAARRVRAEPPEDFGASSRWLRHTGLSAGAAGTDQGWTRPGSSPAYAAFCADTAVSLAAAPPPKCSVDEVAVAIPAGRLDMTRSSPGPQPGNLES